MIVDDLVKVLSKVDAHALLTELDLEIRVYRPARDSFWEYRKLIHPELIEGWWIKEISEIMQQFYLDLQNGKRPKVVISSPPQHGKSALVVDFITWAAGKNPDLRTIYTSFSESLGERANLHIQRIMDSDVYKKVFPKTIISPLGSSNSQSTRNRSLIEYAGKAGSFRNTTVRGQITGHGLDIGCIDDPTKGREEARSLTVREKTWDWLMDDFYTRFSENAGMIVIMTRWHIDDPVGRLKQAFGDELNIYSYPAIAIENEKNREIGEALFPELKSKEFLLERKNAMGTLNFESLYQQNPQIEGGEIIKGQFFRLYDTLPNIKHRMIFADTAQKTAERNDYSVFECWGVGVDGNAYLIDLIRGKWEAPELRRRAVAFWQKHKALNGPELGVLRKMMIEDKASGTGLIQDMKVEGQVLVGDIQRTKDKYTRVLDVVGYIEAGKVHLPKNAPWLNDFITECESFTADDSHMHDDQIDPMIDAINEFLVVSSTLAIWQKLGR
jgi:predicted phage terminase large subunit-like protein